MLKCYECDQEIVDNIKAIDGHVFCCIECRDYYTSMSHIEVKHLKPIKKKR